MKLLFERLYEHALEMERLGLTSPSWRHPALIRDLKEAAERLMPKTLDRFIKESTRLAAEAGQINGVGPEEESQHERQDHTTGSSLGQSSPNHDRGTEGQRAGEVRRQVGQLERVGQRPSGRRKDKRADGNRGPLERVRRSVDRDSEFLTVLDESIKLGDAVKP